MADTFPPHGRHFSPARQALFLSKLRSFLPQSRLHTFSRLALNFKTLRCKLCSSTVNICSPTMNNGSPTMNRYPSSVNRFCHGPCFWLLYTGEKPCFLGAKIQLYFRISKLLLSFLGACPATPAHLTGTCRQRGTSLSFSRGKKSDFQRCQWGKKRTAILTDSRSTKSFTL